MYNDRRRGGGIAVLLAACIVAAAILVGPCGDGRSAPPVSESSVRQQVTEQLRSHVQPRPPAAGEYALKRVVIREVRFSRTQDRLLVAFDLIFEPAATVSGETILTDDGFGRYRGEWKEGRFRVPLRIQ
jgi:hypothetical protein